MPKSARRKQVEAVVLYPLDWLEERSGLVGATRYFLFRKVPGDTGWAQTLGSATLTAFLVQAITGVILAMFYKPDPEHAYSSIQYITNDVTFGWLVRGMHRWGASVFIILLFFHMARVFLVRRLQVPARAELDHRRPAPDPRHVRGLHRLPAPLRPDRVLGDGRRHEHHRERAVRGRDHGPDPPGRPEIGTNTLSRFYSLHMLVAPGLIFALIGLHLYLVIRLGVTSPPWSKEAAGADYVEPEPEPPARAGLVAPTTRGRPTP